jgi:y4mF family transcriptional regulator
MRKKRRKESEIKSKAGSIAIIVRERRKLLGYSQEALSARAGVGVRFLRELEQGKKTIRIDKVNQVLFLFGMELAPVDLPKVLEDL